MNKYARIIEACSITVNQNFSRGRTRDDLDRVYFRKALALLADSKPSFQLNDGTGRRYFVMSKLFQEVVDRLMQTKQ